MWTDGAYRPFLQDRHFRGRLEFPDRRFPWRTDGVERKAGASPTTIALDIKPAQAAVETLRAHGRLRR
jgi:hypothetical protein